MADADSTPRAPDVVFIRGITQRSGTNFLRDLLLLHPDCGRARAPVWEDFALDEADVLDTYLRRTVARWPSSWGVPKEAVAAEMRAALGTALLGTLIGAHQGTTTVAKTPSVRGLERFFSFFPDQRLIVLVRDGRDVVESMTRSFGWSFERSLHEWTAGARAVLRFRRRMSVDEGRTWLLVRYEEVLDDPAGQVRRIFRVVGLDGDRVDAADVARLPVRGSSTFATDAGVVHWRPVPSDGSFRPRAHWADWTPSRHRRFNHVAGGAMAALGYEVVPSGPVGAAARIGFGVQTMGTTAMATARTLQRTAGARLRPQVSDAGSDR